MARYQGTIELLGHASAKAVEVMLDAANSDDAAHNAPEFVHSIDPTLRLGRVVEAFAEVPGAVEKADILTGSINLLPR